MTDNTFILEEAGERYVVVTTVSQFRQRYCIPMSELQKTNPDKELTVENAREWAMDTVTMEEADEFSQKWMGETILDTMILDEERVLLLFDRDNDYLQGWTKEKKLEWIHDWKFKNVTLG